MQMSSTEFIILHWLCKTGRESQKELKQRSSPLAEKSEREREKERERERENKTRFPGPGFSQRHPVFLDVSLPWQPKTW
jgi:hypothetical protein